MSSIFCPSSELKLQCKEPIFEEFTDETDIIILILEYFRKFLPSVMYKKKDWSGQPIKIDPNDIGIRVQKDSGNYLMVLVPLEDNSTYPDDMSRLENSDYVFQIQIQVREEDTEASLENLLKFKSGIKTMLVNMGHNIGLNVNIDGFAFDGPFSDPQSSNKQVRVGIYRFSVIDTKVRE